MNYKNDPLFRFLQSNGAQAPDELPIVRGESGNNGFCCIEEGGKRPDCQGGVAVGKSLAMVYSPYQHFDELYETGEALCRGTLFRALDKPFLASGRGV